MRCPVPYALLGLLGWGILDVVAARAHALVRVFRRSPRPSRYQERDGPGAAR